MLGYKVFGAGVPGLAVQAICQDAATGLTAAGTTQGTALQLVNAVNGVATVAANTGVVLFATATAGDTQAIFNGGANTLSVYPQSGAKINGLATNQKMFLPVNTGVILHCLSSTQWFAVLSA